MELFLLNDLKIGATKVNNFWIKHSDLEDEIYLEVLHEKFLALALKRKIPLEKEAIILAEKNGTWTNANQRDLESTEAYSYRLQESYDKVIEAQKKYIKEELDHGRLKLYNLKQKKSAAIGKTAEDWAFRLSNERYILSLFYKDKSLLERRWASDDMEMLEQYEVDFAIKDYMIFRDKLSDENLKNLSCSGFCQNLYYIAGGSFNFFGRSIIEMSCFQQRFCILLENYKNIISQISGKVADSTLSNWRELDKWAKSSERGKEDMERSWSKGGGDTKINYENIKKASMIEGEEKYAKNIQTILS